VRVDVTGTHNRHYPAVSWGEDKSCRAGNENYDVPLADLGLRCKKQQYPNKETAANSIELALPEGNKILCNRAF
jgi:hypothetical protein